MPNVTPGDELKAEISQLAPDGAFIWLAQVELFGGEILRVANSHQSVVFLGEAWQPFPFEEPQIREDMSGELVSTRVSFTDHTGYLVDLIRKNNALADRPVTLLKVPTALLGTPLDSSSRRNYLTFHFTVIAVTSSRTGATLDLGAQSAIRLAVPQLLAGRNTCRWAYKGVECGYTGPLPTCDRTWDSQNGCIAHNNAGAFGGFPAISRSS
jgi:phage-related protein